MVKKYIALALIGSLICSSAITNSLATDIEAEQVEEAVRGVFIDSNNNGDFPSTPNLNSKSLNDEIDEIVKDAKLASLNTIYFEVRSEGDALYQSKEFPSSQFWLEQQGDFSFYDPLKQLVSAAKKEDIDVVAVVNPFYLGDSNENLASSSILVTNPEQCVQFEGDFFLSPTAQTSADINAKDINSIADEYDVSGVMLKGIDDYRLIAQDGYIEMLDNLTLEIKSNLSSKQKLITSISSPTLTDEQLNTITKNSDNVVVSLDASTDYHNNEFSTYLSYYSSILGDKLIASISSDNSEMFFQNFLVMEEDLGVVYENYSLFSEPSVDTAILNAAFSTNIEPYALYYTPPTTLAITHPKQDYRTNTDTFYITGTSNPNLPLTINGETINRTTHNGSFGVLVDLDVGVNTFTLSQGSEVTYTYRIERYVPTQTAGTTNKITSMYPTDLGLAYSSENLYISCVAPSGAYVSATIAGKTYVLEQVAAASDSVPATFRATIILEDPTTSLKNLGKVTYNLTHNGANSSYTSEGDLYIAPQNASIFAEITVDMQRIYSSDDYTQLHTRIYREGTIEEIDEVDIDYIKTISGAYIPFGGVKFVDSANHNDIKVTSAELVNDEESVRFVLEGGAGIPYAVDDLGGGKYSFTFFTPNAITELSLPVSEYFSSITPNLNNTNGYELVFNATSSHIIWGYDVFYNDDGDAEIFFKLAPKKSDDPLLPLKNVTVVIDPGHGGVDIGAPSALRTLGPHESEFALNTSMAIEDQLENLGATVVMIREDDSRLYLDERAIITRETEPHISLSVHYNSHAETTDANTVNGIETYWYFDNAQTITEMLGDYMVEGTGRNLRRASFGNYYVTRYSFTTALLLETGFMPSPIEYTQTMDPFEMYKCGVMTAKTFADYVEMYGRE